MRSDVPQLRGPLTGCSDWADELTRWGVGGTGHGGGTRLVAAFLEAACEIAALRRFVLSLRSLRGGH